jgi:mutator protein MutT
MNFILRNFFRLIPSDNFARKYPVSIKGLVFMGDKLLLVKNERDEWEPPGGKIEPAETPEQCVLREIKEELNITAEIDSLLDAWIYKVGGKVNCFVVIYLCKPLKEGEREIKLSFEHNEYGLFTLDEIKNLNMPGRYKNTLEKIYKHAATFHP